jgi:hypothetical protein
MHAETGDSAKPLVFGDPALAGRNLMREVRMYVTAWSNGRPLRTGAGYGIRLSVGDRDLFFDPHWSDVSVDFADGEPVLVPLSRSFWRSCPELRSAAIGRWLLRNGLAPGNAEPNCRSVRRRFLRRDRWL